MPSLNKVTIIGHVGKEPEIRSFQNGGKIASFTVATSEGWKDKESGEWKERTEWHRVSVMNNDYAITNIEKNLKKGSLVYIDGQLETRKWADKDGKDNYTTEILVRVRGQVLIMDKKESTGTAKDAQKPSGKQPVTSNIPDDFDEIPF